MFLAWGQKKCSGDWLSTELNCVHCLCYQIV